MKHPRAPETGWRGGHARKDATSIKVLAGAELSGCLVFSFSDLSSTVLAYQSLRVLEIGDRGGNTGRISWPESFVFFFVAFFLSVLTGA